MLRQLIVLSLLLILAHGKSVYDQRQDGGTNYHGVLDNIMIVLAYPEPKGSGSLISDIASQILFRNKKPSVLGEEIPGAGNDAVSVKIQKSEGDPAQGNVNQGQEGSARSPELSDENHSKALEIPKTQDIVVHIDGKPNEEIPKEDPQILKKLGINSRNSEGIIPQEIEKAQKEIIADEIKAEKIESPEKEKPEKFISFGTISSVDGKVIYESEKKQSDDSEGSQPEKKSIEKGTIEKSAKAEDKVRAIEGEEKSLIDILLPQESKKDGIGKAKEILAEIPKAKEETVKVEQVVSKKLEDQAEKSSKKAESHKSVISSEKKTETEKKIIPKSRRVQRELKSTIYSKGRTSLKKELPRIDDLKDEEAGDKNEVRLIVDQKSQLKPIGEMLENCGPGRIRNRYGICQFDESFN